ADGAAVDDDRCDLGRRRVDARDDYAKRTIRRSDGYVRGDADRCCGDEESAHAGMIRLRVFGFPVPGFRFPVRSSRFTTGTKNQVKEPGTGNRNLDPVHRSYAGWR